MKRFLILNTNIFHLFHDCCHTLQRLDVGRALNALSYDLAKMESIKEGPPSLSPSHSSLDFFNEWIPIFNLCRTPIYDTFAMFILPYINLMCCVLSCAYFIEATFCHAK